MKQFFDDYFNIRKMIESKREYKQYMNRVQKLPEDYQFVFKKIQNYIWQFVASSGYDMMSIQNNLLELFEEGTSRGKKVLEITGDDVAGFADELLKNARTYTEDWKTKLNREISEKLNVNKKI